MFGLAILAGLGYALTGKPGQPDQPLSGRIASFQKILKEHPKDLTTQEVMLVAQRNAQLDPKNPGPHYAMGYILEEAGKVDEAALAYQSALRRDPNFEPAIAGLADINFEMSGGRIDGQTMKLYQQAFALKPDDVRLGYMIGIGEWQAGEPNAAKALWGDLEAKSDPDGAVLRPLAQVLFQTAVQSGGTMAPWTLEFYRTLYQKHPDQLQLGYLEGVGLWQNGDHDGAEKLWASIEAKAPKDDTTMPQMFAALKAMAKGEGMGPTQGQAPGPGQPPAAPAAPKAPG